MIRLINEKTNTSPGVFDTKALADDYLKSQGITDTSDYNLYGAMYQGTIYKIDLNGTITALNTSGNQWYGITQGSDKKLYGSVNNGFIYSISLDGVETAITSTNRGWYGICQVNVVQPVIKSVFVSYDNISFCWNCNYYRICVI